MKHHQRKELIAKSIKFRVLKRNNILFVNMFAVTKSYNFSCKIEDIGYELDKMVFTNHCIITNFSIKGQEVDTEAYFTEITIKRNLFKGMLSNGQIIECKDKEFDFDSITPTKEELKKLIFDKVEEF